jgi:hypothetical protein
MTYTSPSWIVPREPVPVFLIGAGVLYSESMHGVGRTAPACPCKARSRRGRWEGDRLLAGAEQQRAAAPRPECQAPHTATGDVLGLRIPAELAKPSSPAVPDADPAPDDPQAAGPPRDVDGNSPAGWAVELDRVVPLSGNLLLAGQQIWLGPAMTGRTVRLHAGLDRVHVLLDGYRVKTLPSRLDARDLARLAAGGATPAGPAPLPPASGGVIEVERTVNASGNVSLGNHMISVGLPLAGQRITLRLDGLVAHIVSAASWPALSPARSRQKPGPGCAVPGPERRSRRACPTRSQ